MTFLISLGLAVLFVLLLEKPLRAHPVPFYVGVAAIALAVMGTAWSGTALPDWVTAYVWPVLARGGLAGALFVVVMFTGAFPNASRPMKKLMPIRGQLSILASILTLGHNTAYGKTYFAALFTDPASLPLNQRLAAVCSLLMLAIMLPLFVTSFQFVRRKMRPKTWKRLQRWAYGFYALLAVHILLLTVPRALRGEAAYRLTVFVYGAVFLSYLVCRTIKAAARDKRTSRRLVTTQISACLCCAVLSAAAAWLPAAGNAQPDSASVPTDSTPGTAQDAQPSGQRPDGVYTGKAMGMNAPIEVSVTVEAGRIVDIAILSARDDEPYFSDALAVIDAIIAANSTQVDAVSGATYSSGGIMDAVEDALSSEEGGGRD